MLFVLLLQARHPQAHHHLAVMLVRVHPVLLQVHRQVLPRGTVP